MGDDQQVYTVKSGYNILNREEKIECREFRIALEFKDRVVGISVCMENNMGHVAYES